MEFLVNLYLSELLWVYKREGDFSISMWMRDVYFWRANFSERAAKALLFIEVGSMIFIPLIFCLTSHQTGWYRVVTGMSGGQLTSQCRTSMSIFFASMLDGWAIFPHTYLIFWRALEGSTIVWRSVILL